MYGSITYDGYTFEYKYYKGEPEVWTERNGDPGTPGSGDEVEITEFAPIEDEVEPVTDETIEKVTQLILNREY